MSKEVGSCPGFDTPPVIPGNTLLFGIFNYFENWFLGIGKLTQCLQFCRYVDFGLDTIVPTASAQVATPTVSQAPVMPTTVPISVSLGENRRNSVDLISKGDSKRCYST